MERQPYKARSSTKAVYKKQNQKKTMYVVAASLAAACILVAIIAALPKKKEKVLPATSVLPVVSSVPAPAVTPPVSSSQVVETTTDAPNFVFTEAEIEPVTTLLEQWVAEVKPEEEDYGHNVAVYFKDIDTGAEYIYNPEHKFFIASVVKAPHAMYIYHLAETGVANLEDVITVTPEMLVGSEENSGILKEETDLPKNYTINELIGIMLRYSDTAAQRILKSKYPVTGYTEYATGLGLHYPEDIGGITSGEITAGDAGVYATAIYNYIQTGKYGAEFKEHLLHTNNTLIRSQYPVAHKYGWDASSYHDMAVVYAPHPYVIAILTDKSDGTWAENGKFGDIAKLFETIMQPKWQQLDEYNAAIQNETA